MVTKTAGYCGKILAAVFTSIVAPLVVHLVVQEIPIEEARSAREELTISPAAGALRQSDPSGVVPTPLDRIAEVVPQPDEVVQVIACGAGQTPEAALRDALDTALRQVINDRIGTRNVRAVTYNIWRGADGLILRWQELRTRKEWKLKGRMYHKEVAVEVNGRVLADRLMAVSAFGLNNRPSILASH